MEAQFAHSRPPQAPANRKQRRKAKAMAATPDPRQIARLTDLLRQQQFAEGGSQAEQFAKRWPNHPLGWTVLGMCLTALGAFLMLQVDGAAHFIISGEFFVVLCFDAKQLQGVTDNKLNRADDRRESTADLSGAGGADGRTVRPYHRGRPHRHFDPDGRTKRPPGP